VRSREDDRDLTLTGDEIVVRLVAVFHLPMAGVGFGIVVFARLCDLPRQFGVFRAVSGTGALEALCLLSTFADDERRGEGSVAAAAAALAALTAAAAAAEGALR
jgi:hypothetical protein